MFRIRFRFGVNTHAAEGGVVFIAPTGRLLAAQAPDSYAMSSNPEDRPYSESSLESGEYRQRLQRKLNCLIAVLEVALAKVRRSLDGPDPDLERLRRIQKNLGDTLKVCRRAKTALERHDELPAELGETLSGVVQSNRQEPGVPRGVQVEMDSCHEAERFAAMQPIDTDSIRHVDFDELARLLQG